MVTRKCQLKTTKALAKLKLEKFAISAMKSCNIHLSASRSKRSPELHSRAYIFHKHSNVGTLWTKVIIRKAWIEKSKLSKLLENTCNAKITSYCWKKHNFGKFHWKLTISLNLMARDTAAKYTLGPDCRINIQRKYILHRQNIKTI